MARKNWLAKVLMFVFLEIGVLGGAALPPEQIEELMKLMNGAQIVAVARREDDGDGDPPAG
ncbi:MAG: hypothetical protein U0X73_17045 [Thermoanaerobaculia bacterium]